MTISDRVAYVINRTALGIGVLFGFYRYTARVPRGRTEIFDFRDDERPEVSRTT